MGRNLTLEDLTRGTGGFLGPAGTAGGFLGPTSQAAGLFLGGRVGLCARGGACEEGFWDSRDFGCRENSR